MKNIAHHCFIITCDDLAIIQIVKEEIMVLLKRHLSSSNSRQLLSTVIPSIINGFYTIVIAPDGSKEGYDVSEESDRFRASLVHFINSLEKEDGSNSVRFAEVMYGCDNKGGKGDS